MPPKSGISYRDDGNEILEKGPAPESGGAAELCPPCVTGGLAQQPEAAFGAAAAALGANPEARLRVVLCDRQGRHLVDELIDAHVARFGDLLKALALVGGACE